MNDGFEEISRGELVEAGPEQVEVEVPMADKWLARKQNAEKVEASTSRRSMSAGARLLAPNPTFVSLYTSRRNQ